jgi:ABC-type branched-subunit amino acid transport system ATPase component
MKQITPTEPTTEKNDKYILITEGLTKFYGKSKAIENISLAVEKKFYLWIAGMQWRRKDNNI